MTKALPLIISKLSGPDAHETAISQIQRHRGPAIVSSFGPSLYYRTFQTRARRGEVMRFDPFALSGDGHQTWSLLHGCEAWDGALDVAWHLAATAHMDGRNSESGDFWQILAEQCLAPLLFAAARTGHDITTLVSWAYSDNDQPVESTLDGLVAVAGTSRERDELAKARAATDAFAGQPDRTRTCATATVQALLRVYRFTRVAQSAASCEITPERLFAGSNTLYLIGDAKASKLLRPLMVALLEQLVSSGHSPTYPLLLAEVEHENVGTLIDAHVAAHMARNGRLRRLTVPSKLEIAPARKPPKRRLHLRSPLTLS